MSPTANWLPFLVWAYSTRFYELDTIIEENVPQLLKDVLHDILNDFSPSVLKDVFTRSDHQLQAVTTSESLCLDASPRGDRDFMISSRRCDHHGAVFSPTQLGVPSERWRQDNAFNLWPFVQCKFGAPFDALSHQ